MPISRFLFFSSKRHSRETFSLLRRFGPSKRIQSCNYVKSSRNGNGKPESNRIMNVDIQAPRSWGTYVIPAALLGFAGLAAFVHYNDERRAIPKVKFQNFILHSFFLQVAQVQKLGIRAMMTWQGNHSTANTTKGPIIGGPFTLIDTENRTITERNLRGNWVLLYFGYTSSPDVGPEQVRIMAKTIDKLESRHNVKVLPVFVTIDPQRDTPLQLCAYLQEFDPRIVGLTGPVSAIRHIAQEYRVYFKKVEEEGDDYLVESSHNMYLLNPNMEVVRCFGIEYNEDELGDSILKELKRTQS
ncbi:hypothetical protein TIFTF001_004317 [Ficus carica]|uniref:Uncharacterized protein n=1 Tax=Ficus carica TaxID=3494 RepID=A0AA88CWZ9_FICCA|nr:hypothetical protein TIFTF001_004317 [Ficus carica]